MSIKAWSDQDEKQLIFLYTEDDLKDVHELATIFNKGYRSVISKLVQLKIYEKPSDKEQEPNKTVKMMLIELENILEIEIEGVNLNKKENLKKLLDAVVKKVN
jgi:hypothetical protein|tara:strand:- start:244 stop:552 length:309 start_codon:yes stop_codon:yes gene_type:complete